MSLASEADSGVESAAESDAPAPEQVIAPLEEEGPLGEGQEDADQVELAARAARGKHTIWSNG